MKLSYIFLFSLTFLIHGCWSDQKVAVDSAAAPVSTPQPEKPVPQKAPALQAPVVKKQPVAKAADLQSTPKKVEKNILPPKTVSAETPKRPAKPAPGSERPSERFRRGPGLWKAFSTLSPEEQRELMKIQRQDPEKFKQLMQAKVEALYKAEQSRRQEQNELVKKYHSAKNPAEKEKIKAELRKKINEDFQKRLAATRRDLETNKKRIARMETELQKREKKRDKIVEAILLNRLSDNPRPMPDKRRK